MANTTFMEKKKAMEENKEIQLAWDFVEHTAQSIFLTGKAGTGKTTFLRMVTERSCKRMVVVAPTGVAAINAGGVTIHSFFQLPLSPFLPHTTIKNKFNFSKNKINIIRTLDLLIIDEISMVRSDLLDAIDSVLRRYRHKDKPFGGVQLLMIGDLQQLTPVVTANEEELLCTYYDTPYFFGSHALQRIPYVTIQLQKVYRQQDGAFLEILNRIRNGKVTQSDVAMLNDRYNPTFKPRQEDGYIRLTTHNQKADNYNNTQLQALPKKMFQYRAKIKGTFPEYMYPTAEVLELKVGAQVMFIKNDSTAEHLYYNGKIGHVIYLDAESIEVLCTGDENSIVVELQEWENTTYQINSDTNEIEPKVQGVFCQFPLRLAWAITIHKSQGLTFAHAMIDAQLSFAPGQVYVALSRCKTLEGLVLSSPISAEAIINDHRVANYIQHQEEDAKQSIALLPTLKDAYLRMQLIELFNFMDIWRTEDMISRLYIEFFHAYPSVTVLHKSTVKALQEKVNIIAYKWTSYLEKIPVAMLREEKFLERIKASALYFSKTLKQYIAEAIVQSKSTKSNNKQAMKRLDTYLADLQEQYTEKQALLMYIATHGFEIETYRKVKYEIALGIIKNETTTERKKSTLKKEKQPKKVSTKDITLQMLNDGLLPNEIAKQRQLTLSTIYTHIAYFVEKQKLSVSRFVTSEHYQSIRLAIEKVGKDKSIYAIKELCLPDVTYGEIKIVMASMKE